MATVKVAVRVRPFNQREIDGDCQKIIEMQGKTTKIINIKIPETAQGGDIGRERNKEFFFDFSHDSFDQKDEQFVSQEQVYEDLGTDVVQSAFEGYNACVFAYGQTGSGKTYTMMGTPDSVGLIPRICQNLFDQMKKGENAGTTYRTEVSYLEIYNEKVKDLLLPNRRNQSLRVREHPRFGPYVQDLSRHLVMDYEDIREWILKGNAVRTTASTNMNDTSSRSHAIFTITFVQAKFSQEMPSETVSKINLVDLAGSERADSSGATGQRLKEGGHINKSLVTLGSVISALADIPSASKNNRQVFVPYRDSVLTWLLKDSLGGNSKTIMIAAISPADVNYGETLSTLRYANRAKNIVNKPTINEDPNVKLIRELRNEIGRLKNMLSTTSTQNGNSSLIVELRANEEKVKVLTEEWTERWKETKKILEEQTTLALRKSGVGVVLDSDKPHLVGIDDSIYSSGMTFYPLKEGSTYIGGESATPKPEIVITVTADMSPHPCSIELNSGKALLNPLNNSSCYVLVDTNTLLVDEPTQLTHGCVIVVGRNMFRYNDPPEAAKLRKEKMNGSDLNLSRLSFLSQSSPDLRRSLQKSSNTSVGQLLKTSTDDIVDADCHTSSTMSNSKITRDRLNVVTKNNLVNNENANETEHENLHNQLSGENNQNVLNCDKNNLTEKPETTPMMLPLNELESNVTSSHSMSLLKLTETDLSPGNETIFHLAVQRSNSISSTPKAVDGSFIRKCKSEIAIMGTKDAGVNCRLNSSGGDDDEEEEEGGGAGESDMVPSVEINSAKLRCMQQYLEQIYKDINENNNNNNDRQKKVEKLKRHFSKIEKELRSTRQHNLSDDNDSEFSFCGTKGSTLDRRHSRCYKSSLSIPTEFERVPLTNEDHDFEVKRSSRSCCSSPTKSSQSSFCFDGPNNLDVLEEYEIFVSVPFFIMRGSSKSPHFEYEIKITCRNETWSIYRRYKRFEELHKALRQKYRNMMRSVRLPPRWYFWQSSSEELAEKRRQHLEMYLRDVLTKCLSTKECLLFAYADSLTRQSLCEFIPFFRKGDFENTKFSTS